MAEELQKLWEEVALQQKKKKAGPVVIPPDLSVSNDSVFNDSLKFIFIFTFYNIPTNLQDVLHVSVHLCFLTTTAL